MGGLEVLAPGYDELWRRAESVLNADDRVTSVEPSGSVANGIADEWSDLDLSVCVRDEQFDSFLSDWEDWLAAITPTVFAQRPIAPFIINTVTAAGLTFDIAIYRASTGPFKPPTGHVVGMLASTRYPNHASAVAYTVLELFRGLSGPFITFLRRSEHVRHLAGVTHLLGLLTAVMLAENDAPPLGKRLNPLLTPEQLRVLESLPPVAINAESIMEFELAVAREVVTRARPLFQKFGLEWPSALEKVATERVRRYLGVELYA